MSDYAKRILKVLVYIEEHIQDEMSVEELAQIACYSPFHFQRVFRFIVGQSIALYVKRLRMERAIQKLRHSDQSITDIALDTRFGTPSAFTKAFKQYLGKGPRNYRLLFKELDMAEKRITNLAMIEPDAIKKLPDVPVLFIREKGNYETAGQNAWNAIKAFIKKHNLDETKLRYFGIAHDDPDITEEENLRYDACIQEVPHISGKEELSRRILPGGKYAIFSHHGSPDMMPATYDRIILKWLPQSNENFEEKRFCFVEHKALSKVNRILQFYIPLV